MVSTSVTMENIIHVHGHTHWESFLVCTCAVSGTYWKRKMLSASVPWFKNRNNTNTFIHRHTHMACSSETEEMKSIWVAQSSVFPLICHFFLFFFFLHCVICPFSLFPSLPLPAVQSISDRKPGQRQQRRKSKRECYKWQQASMGIRHARFCITAVPRPCVWVIGTCKCLMSFTALLCEWKSAST